MTLGWFVFSLGISVAFAGHGVRKQSLSPAGAAVAVGVGFVQMFCGPRFGITLLVFYFTSSQLTKYKTKIKAKVEEDYRKHGQRRPIQVLANGFGGCVFAALAKYMSAHDPRSMDIALAAFLGHVACCCSDTWSSELGVLSKEKAILITTGKEVPRGTNGGVTGLGTAAGAAGGLLMGLTFWAAGFLDGTQEHSGLALVLVPLGLALGLLGTVLDSVLGATCQYTGYSTKLGRVVGQPGPDVGHLSGLSLLSNDGVNFVASGLTALIGASVIFLGMSKYDYGV